MRIVLDGMGSDTYPDPELTAAMQAAELFNEEIILVGDQNILGPKIESMGSPHSLVRLHHAPDIVDMSDKAVESSKIKPENSMAVGLELVRNGEADAFITAGNSGAALFNAVKILHRIEGIRRPAMITAIPTVSGKCAFLDTGANADCRPEFLAEFAIMGCIYAEKVLGVNNPRIGLLANGEEAGKGNQLIREAYPLLMGSKINFVGNTEPKEVFAGKVDVIVADGFSGNIFLKTSESIAKFITDILKDEIQKKLTGKIGYLLLKPAFNQLKRKLDPAEVGAALLLGVKGYVFIGHGRSDARALVSAIRLARQAVSSHLLDTLAEEITLRISA